MIAMDRLLEQWRARHCRLILLGAVCCLASAAAPLPAQEAVLPQSPNGTVDANHVWAPLDRPGAKLIDTLSCASASCHGQSVDDAFRDGTARQEYFLWLEHDPHAKAARTLDSPAFQRILALVSSGHVDGAPSPETYARCAHCHDPEGLAGRQADPQLAALPAGQGTRGIGCQSCHGAAENWLTEHYRRDMTREQLSKLGMTDTRNVLVRARRCAACHVGDETHDMNHDMIAAGHPPLRFELSAYHDLIRRKHWSDAERIETPQFKVQLWAAGQLAVAESTLAMLQSRAQRAAASEADGQTNAPWPEFAEFDCFACHQRMRQAGNTNPVRQRGIDTVARTGNPPWQPWNLALLPRLMQQEMRWEPALHVNSTEALSHAIRLRTTVREHALGIALTQAAESPSPAYSAGDLLTLIEKPAAGERATWAAACHELLALKAAYLAWRDERQKLDPSRGAGSHPAVPLMDQEDALADDDRWSSAFRQDLDDLAAALRFGSGQFEWPAFDWDGLPLKQRKQPPKFGSLHEIQGKIRELAAQLRQQYARPTPTIILTTMQP